MPRGTTIKPSPHRFLPAQEDSAAASTAPKTRSRFRQQVDDAHIHDDGQQRSDKASQFSTVPKFSQGPALRNQIQPRSPPKSSFVQALQPSKRPPESVEDSSDPQEDDEMLEIERQGAFRKIEEQAQDFTSKHLPFSPKRRRLDVDHAVEASQAPVIQQTPRLAPHPFNRAPVSTTLRGASAHPGTRDDTTSHARPAFIRPAAPSVQTHEPLPETFSPHKRGAKFVAGGMASTVQQWVIEAGQTAVNSRKGRGYNLGEDYVKQVQIDDVIGTRAFTASGILSDHSSINIVLAGKGTGDAEMRSTRPGSVIGVRAPTWDLKVDGTTWLVAVDWKLLS